MSKQTNDITKEQVINYLQEYKKPEPVICSVFGCGKPLAEWEQLYGDKCMRCSIKKKQDIMNVIKVPE